MTVKMTWHSHACFLIDPPRARLLIDPFLTGKPLASGKADEIQTDYILVSHGHGDHPGDRIDIARRTRATVMNRGESIEI